MPVMDAGNLTGASVHFLCLGSEPGDGPVALFGGGLAGQFIAFLAGEDLPFGCLGQGTGCAVVKVEGFLDLAGGEPASFIEQGEQFIEARVLSRWLKHPFREFELQRAIAHEG